MVITHEHNIVQQSAVTMFHSINFLVFVQNPCF